MRFMPSPFAGLIPIARHCDEPRGFCDERCDKIDQLQTATWHALNRFTPSVPPPHPRVPYSGQNYDQNRFKTSPTNLRSTRENRG